MQTKRVFLIVLDSVGIGAEPDAHLFGDEGSNTLGAVREHINFNCPNMVSLGLFNIDGVGGGVVAPRAAHARLQESSMGKDTTIGHWEIAGILSEKPLPTYPCGFPDEIIAEFERVCGRKTLCNKPYSGTDVIRDYGEEHIKTGALIVYTSADSVFQIACHESIYPPERLYEICEAARELLTGEHGVGRVLARPFIGNNSNDFTRTSNRRDFSLKPPKDNLLVKLTDNDIPVMAVGKIEDIFCGEGITYAVHTKDNNDGIDKTIEYMENTEGGLIFTNLVEFDSVWGHRNNTEGYAKGLEDFDSRLPEIISRLKDEDILIITADHGCDPTTESTDHSREYVPVLFYGNKLKNNINLGTGSTFANIGQTVAEYLGIGKVLAAGDSLVNIIVE